MCLSDTSKRVSECSASRAKALIPEKDDSVFIATRKAPWVRYVDMTDWICGAASCDSVVGGVLVWRDTNHLTGTYAKSLAPALLPEIKEALKNKNVQD